MPTSVQLDLLRMNYRDYNNNLQTDLALHYTLPPPKWETCPQV